MQQATHHRHQQKPHHSYSPYPSDIGQAIYTTNAIDSFHSVVRKTIKNRKLFPTDFAAKTVNYLPIREASKIWAMPIRYWKLSLSWHMIEFEERPMDYI